MQCRQAHCMRLNFCDARRRDACQSRHAVLGRGALQRLDPTEFRIVDRDDQLAAHVVWQSPFRAELAEKVAPSAAQRRLEAAWLVVDAGVNHARVVTCLVYAEAIFLLEDVDSEAWIPPRDLPADRQPDDSSSHHTDGKI